TRTQREPAKTPPLPKGFDVERKGRYRGGGMTHPKTARTPRQKRQSRPVQMEDPEDGGRMRAVLDRYLLVVGRWPPHYNRACLFATHRSSNELSHCAWYLEVRRSRLGTRYNHNRGVREGYAKLAESRIVAFAASGQRVTTND